MPIHTTDKQKWFKKIIIERFFSEQEMAEFLDRYEAAKIDNIGRREVEKDSYDYR
jgi:hypothetical protein